PESLRKRVTYHSLKDHVRNFLDSVKSRQEPNAPVEVGHRSATICHLGNIAIELKAKLKWDPESETFAGPRSGEANRLLDRPQRTEWQS
ncbi:MAG: gfo/Idh/MocA family oxidoreductase, partial [Pirellulaceae bacterium]|nr:gfo/Idh/MocA family oxidoreductase [Pirellulaceae bacterium]